MIQVFKIIKRIYDPTCVPHFDHVELIQLGQEAINTTSLSLWLKKIQFH